MYNIKPKISRWREAQYFRNFTFGVEDSLVSTVGVLSGVAAANEPTKTIVLAGVVLLFVEAFSMGVGSLLSEETAEEFKEKRDVPIEKSFKPGLIMFASYFLAGFIPLTPYILLDRQIAFKLSIISSLAALFLLGIFSAKISHTNPLKQGFKMLVIGGAAIALGVAVGIFVARL